MRSRVRRRARTRTDSSAGGGDGGNLGRSLRRYSVNITHSRREEHTYPTLPGQYMRMGTTGES